MSDPFLDEAIAIADRIASAAIYHRAAANWVVRKPSDHGTALAHERPSARTLGPALHAGTAGVGLFLARVASVTHARDHERAARGAIEHALEHASAIARVDRHGYTVGALGVAWAAHEAGERLREPSFTRRAAALVGAVHKQRGATKLDVIAGNAGGILVLLDLASRGAVVPEGFAAELGDGLVRAARRKGDQWSWATTPDRVHLLGLSHGTAGIALALARLHKAHDDDRYLEAARGALRYEREHFDAHRGGWPKLAAKRVPAQPMTAWCHGAAGAGVARVALRALWDDDTLQKEAELALGFTLERLQQLMDLPGFDHSLCHGTIGVLECADLVDRALGGRHAAPLRDAAMLAVDRYGAAAREAYGSTIAFPTHAPPGRLDPGLFTGESGIGQHFLWRHDPAAFPTVLVPQL